MSKSNLENEFADEKFSKNWLQNMTSNPDLLSELDTLFPSVTLESDQEMQYDRYLKVIENVKFTKQQKIVWELFSLKCYTVTRIANYLRLNKSTISRTLQTAISKIKDKCEQEQLKEASNSRNMLGFQKGITVKGQTETDPLFKERLEQHKLEIELFYKEHPELREKRKKDENR